MSIAIDKTAERFENISADVPLNNAYPLYDETEVTVIYGKDLITAILNTDYEVALDTENYSFFTITPTAALLTKINDLIADDGTEINYVTVRRDMDNLTSATEETVRSTTFVAREFDRTAMRFQGIKERLLRTLILTPKFVGDVQLIIEAPVPLTVPMWSADGQRLETGPNAQTILDAQVYADQVVEIKAELDALAIEVENDKADAQIAANEAAADAAQIAEALDNLVLGPNQPKSQTYTSGVAGASELTVTNTPYPTIGEAATIFAYGTVGNGVMIDPNTITYNDVLHKFTFDPPLPPDTSKVIIRWWTALNIGTVPDNSINWLTKLLNHTGNTIAAFAADGTSVLRSLVTTLAGATDLLIPTALAVKTYVDTKIAADIATAISGISTEAPVVVASITPSGSPGFITLPDIFRDGYNYRMVFDEIACSTSIVNLMMQFLSLGSTPITSAFYCHSGADVSDSSNSYNANTGYNGTSFMLLGRATDGADIRIVTGEFTIPNPAKTGKLGFLNAFGMLKAADTVGVPWGGYKTLTYRVAGATATGLRLFWNAGNFRNQGKITIWEERI